ncbi:hypothetical protein AVEN_123622-1 [Araneus ventricosus]|uniref:Uncharacterized protein n=1 Tax=Araneus ventricosus TaxID=182803 RepID=A0A4Y2QR28_ARAVE|nr:hypothetical protein AVEN_123622-1 [Araneus ventricosus]
MQNHRDHMSSTKVLVGVSWYRCVLQCCILIPPVTGLSLMIMPPSNAQNCSAMVLWARIRAPTSTLATAKSRSESYRERLGNVGKTYPTAVSCAINLEALELCL